MDCVIVWKAPVLWDFSGEGVEIVEMQRAEWQAFGYPDDLVEQTVEPAVVLTHVRLKSNLCLFTD